MGTKIFENFSKVPELLCQQNWKKVFSFKVFQVVVKFLKWELSGCDFLEEFVHTREGTIL